MIIFSNFYPFYVVLSYSIIFPSCIYAVYFIEKISLQRDNNGTNSSNIKITIIHETLNAIFLYFKTYLPLLIILSYLILFSSKVYKIVEIIVIFVFLRNNFRFVVKYHSKLEDFNNGITNIISAIFYKIYNGLSGQKQIEKDLISNIKDNINQNNIEHKSKSNNEENSFKESINNLNSNLNPNKHSSKLENSNNTETLNKNDSPNNLKEEVSQSQNVVDEGKKQENKKYEFINSRNKGDNGTDVENSKVSLNTCSSSIIIDNSNVKMQNKKSDVKLSSINKPNYDEYDDDEFDDRCDTLHGDLFDEDEQDTKNCIKLTKKEKSKKLIDLNSSYEDDNSSLI